MSDSEPLEAYFGLPADVKFCTRCVMSNQRPSATVEFRNVDKKQTMPIDDDGVCSACREHERKWEHIDYTARQKTLETILDKHRKSDGSYDVVVPGSGGKDSMYVAHVLKHKYGMNPLTVTWPPHMYTDVGRANFDAWISSGVDNVTFHPNRPVHRHLTKLAFLNLLHPFQPFVLGQKNIGPKIALQYGVNLVFYGESSAEGGSFENPDNPKMVPEFFAVSKEEQTNVTIGRKTYQELLKMGFSRADLNPYLPVTLEEVVKSDISVYYMSYFENWRSQEKYYYAQENCGFVPNEERTEGTFTKFASLDDKIDGLQFYTGYIKFGIGRAMFDAAQEIRHRYIDRDEGLALVRRYDGEFPYKYFRECLDYMSINEEEFWAAIDRFRSPHLWAKEGNDWKLRHVVE